MTSDPTAGDRAIEAIAAAFDEYGGGPAEAEIAVDALLSNPGVLRALAAGLPARQLTDAEYQQVIGLCGQAHRAAGDGDNGGPTVAGHILAQIGAILAGSSVAPADATHAHQTTKGNRS